MSMTKPNLPLKVNIDNGFIAIIDYLGTDLTVVNSARVSFGKESKEFNEKDQKLIKYLANHGHTSPFRHCFVQFHIKAPEFVARQWYKHIVGAEYSFKDTGWNEISGRYVEYDTEIWVPKALRKAAINKKQGSSQDLVDNHSILLEKYCQSVNNSFDTYLELLKSGVCHEQARTVLPLSIYTEWYWTASLQAISHFVNLRNSEGAQLEIKEYAILLNKTMEEIFPNSWKALMENNEKEKKT